MFFIDPTPSVQSKLSARELFQPQKPFSKEQDVPQSFSSVPSPQSSMKSQLCPEVKHRPFSQDRKPEGQEPGNKMHIKYHSEFSWLFHNIRLSSLRQIPLLRKSQKVHNVSTVCFCKRQIFFTSVCFIYFTSTFLQNVSYQIQITELIFFIWARRGCQWHISNKLAHFRNLLQLYVWGLKPVFLRRLWGNKTRYFKEKYDLFLCLNLTKILSTALLQLSTEN